MKKRDLEGLRRKNDASNDHLNNKFYSLLFNQSTGIIIVNGDKDKIGTIEFSNKEVENIFKYKTFNLKGMNLNNLMPKIFEKEHSKYMENYFKVGQKTIMDKSDIKTFAKDKDNSIIKVGIAVKLFPILNDNVLFVGLINKENIDDIIFLDDKFNIQGMSTKLMKILNIGNKNLFQENEIPFYVICKKFVNFYKIFLQKGKKDKDADKDILLNELNDAQKNLELKDNKDNKEIEKDDIHENIEINENVELEYEIKLPQFLIDFSEKSKKEEHENMMKLITNTKTKNTIMDSEIPEEEYEEDEVLLENEEKKTNANSIVTPTPMGDTPEGVTPFEGSVGDNSSQNMILNKENEEEKQYNLYMNKYITLFNEGKMNELEELIDVCNKKSNTIEYKFNFTFDKYKYNNKKMAFIVRCIDSKNDIGKSEEESAADLDPKMAKYKKEKADSIKPLFELFEEERKEILALPEIFLNLSIENKKFQKLLQACKNDINILSKTHGQKKDEVLEDENSSQSSQTGFDSGLVKKNRIEEIRNNLMKNISNFHTLKYIKSALLLIFIVAFIYLILYITSILSIFDNLYKSTHMNIGLFQTTLWTTELANIFISLRELFFKEMIGNISAFPILNYTYNDYITLGENNSLYYTKCVEIGLDLCEKLTNILGDLEMEIPKYLSGDELNRLYWNNLNVSYYNENYKTYGKNIYYIESFPLAIAQMISNAFAYLKSPMYNNIFNNVFYKNLSDDYQQYLYSTFLVVENGKRNIIPDEYNKILEIPKILKKYNTSKIKTIDTLMAIFAVIIGLLCILNYFLIHYTYSSMLDGMEKITKIKLEKIKEIIKRITTFGINLKKIREKEIKSDDNRDANSNIYDGESKRSEDINEGKNKKKIDKDLINSSGFNNDTKKYIPLNILQYIFIYSLLTTIVILLYFTPFYFYDISAINKTNNLLIAQNYIYEKLIIASSSIVDVKCFLSGCAYKEELNTSQLADYSNIHEIIKGLNLFSKISEFYNDKFLLDACKAAFLNETSEDYFNCKYNDSLITAAINTENLLKLVKDLIYNIEKENKILNSTIDKFNKKTLFGSDYYENIERIFFKYLFNVEDNFVKCVEEDLKSFLNQFLTINIIFVVSFGIVIIIYYLLSRIFLIKNLIHHLSISRMIMKIIPTSVIISTPELESWIESKY